MIVTSWLIHAPAVYGPPGVLAAAVMMGAVLSRLIVTVSEVVRLDWSVAEQVTLVPAPSALTTVGLQPVVVTMESSKSDKVHDTVGSELFQPLEFGGGEMLDVTTGGAGVATLWTIGVGV